ncbi:hypothetical protein FA13DRAFT_1736345 [Coprinellus micaceus]|uniref:Uncharacterized protein n=1 Tax=Coprinellus micaceus TaxID=71717 RepID=A0A4Y7T040_COPMI|nr:hypothetical protein FA13DRAFT_1736345 [Coprinellus micaceus]
MRPKRNWKELEDRYQGPEAVLMEMLPPFKAPVDEASKNETAMEDVQETNKPTGRATKTGRRLVARVGDSFHPKPKPDLGSPSAAEYPPIPECMEGPVRHPDVKLTWFTITSSLVLDVVPRQIYLHLLLRFPALYFSRVTRIFQDANLGVGEIKRMALEAVDLDKDEGLHRMLVYQGVFPQEWHGGEGKASASYTNLRNSWQGFIDSLMREWKTLNIVSVLLLSAILTILQIDSAASNPLTLFSALLSLVCAFMSLIYGCLFIIRFGTMRKTHKAAEWANESERTSTSIFWNVWVMLAMPAVWLGWSMIFYIVCIMSFVWQTGTATHPRDYLPTDLEILIPRILISCILALGMVYLILIGATFRRYSDPMEQAWQERIQGWLAEKAHTPTGHEGFYQDISGHKQQNHTSNQEAKVVTKERSAPGMYYPPQKEDGSPPRAPALANLSSARNFSPPASQAEKPRSITKIRRPLPTPPGPRRSQEASHAFVGTRSLAKLEGKETRESLSRSATLSFNPFVSFPQTAPTIEKAPTATLSSSTKHLEVEGDVYPGLSHPRLCGGPRPLMQIHGMEPAHSETAGMREEVLPPRRAMAEAPQKDARAVPANASGLEGMEELLVFDWGTHSVHAPLEARVASTSSITTGSLPPATNRVPKGWLEVGLTADAWEGFCTEMACSWVNVVNGRPGAVAEIHAFIDRRNGSLQTFGLAMVFVQSKAGADAWPDRSDARNYTLYWRTRKGAHES